MSSDTSATPGGNTRDIRQQRISDFVIDHGSAQVAELVRLTGVSHMTVHRDIDELVRRGLLRKFRGGVSAQPSTVFESNAEYRLNSHVAAKNAIARKARHLIEPGMSVLLDDSTSALALAPLLADVTPLTVATNYVRTIEALKDLDDIRLIGLGGDYSRTHDSFLGMPCLEAVGNITVDIVFVSTSAMTADMTYHQEPEIVMVKRAMLASAVTKVLLMDSSKLSRTALHRLAPVTDYDRLVVDSDAPDEFIEEAAKNLDVGVAQL
ncbi:DeoR family transcriptional regulator [Prauserella marina]|uniref:DNA-binding transcriptional regulator of sugar metabolism, DeoR/GlpR family n=1 Tax=Prauserella marina TaxID=530584 RepID=A0A222W0Q2_9PSEU|nr:DeoR/GlpR family DNA-binding transcription regulator [Prauserella marina]ASR39759.1 DeoR family transcriptional regulator [Prauserella marina]PWV78448.1 DeoR family transcriptional regulator [Prauserella marina]SDC86225.1 DNA-binding transcriptional regulator of sugar metabolism, DeoR/GlpR family [Prauserella marina]